MHKDKEESKSKRDKPIRQKPVSYTQRNDFSRWKDSVSYVKRWNVETAISTMKIV